MNKLMILGLFVMSLSPFASAEWETSGFIGVQSEYFFRGESQGDDRANQMGLHLENDSGLFGGIWVSEVGVYGDSNWEHDFYAGYKHNMSENVDLYGGVIKYDYDHEWLKIGPDDNGDTVDLKEAYIGGSYKSVSLEHYVDLDNSELTYTEFGYDLPLGLAMIDLKMTRGNIVKLVVQYIKDKEMEIRFEYNGQCKIMVIPDEKLRKLLQIPEDEEYNFVTYPDLHRYIWRAHF